MTRPRATYRLQFRNGMDFDRAILILPYLKHLGVSHLYASPIFKATTGSTHGYDVVDHNLIDPALGGWEGFDRLTMALKRAELGLILDVVPNHMAASIENEWWRDVIEWGSQSVFQDHFDIDWSERLTLPVLGRPYDQVLAADELSIQVDRHRGGLSLVYFDISLPLHPQTYSSVLSRVDEPLAAVIAPYASNSTPECSAETHNHIAKLLSDECASARIDQVLAKLSANPEFIDQVHASQPWRLVFWKDARKHLSYRRFFEVTGLVGVRVEDERVFEDVHRLTLALVRSGRIDGLRIDHVDGLADPRTYLDRLRKEVGPNIYIVVEKILTGPEKLPTDWPIHGTTGYEFIASMADIFVDTGRLLYLDRIYTRSTGRTSGPKSERDAAKRLMLEYNFEAEMSALARLASELTALTGKSFPIEALARALRELIVAFPVYRTYASGNAIPRRDRDLLYMAAEKARTSGEIVDEEALDFALQLLAGGNLAAMGALASDFRKKFQQLTGPIMAKSVEDTLFYRYNRLIALNEVGSEPVLAASLTNFHARMAYQGWLHPDGLLATATHDTKRGEDARARLYAVSEAPELWGDAVERWRGMHLSYIQQLPDGPAPEPETEWLLYQALAGIWPSDPSPGNAVRLGPLSGRFVAYVEKALREAKRRTSWADPNASYEAAVSTYASRMLSPQNITFLEDFSKTLKPLVRAGELNSLAQTLIKMTAPGIPDIYQGTEILDYSLVDPDNRRAVDFEGLARSLGRSSFPSFSIDKGLDGGAKQHLIATCLRLRATHHDLFARGSYIPLRTSGTRRHNIVAFMRARDNDFAIVAVPRLMFSTCQGGLEGGEQVWLKTNVRIPVGYEGRSMNSPLTGERFAIGDRLRAADLFATLPVAMLISD